MEHPENAKKSFLSCPSCAQPLSAVSDDTITCENDHVFTLPALLIGQSIQANTLFQSGLVLLEQQVRLVRSIALELSLTKPDKFLALETQADKLEAVVKDVRQALRGQNA